MEVQYPITFDYLKESGGELIKATVTDIGVWNMDTTNTVSLAFPAAVPADRAKVLLLKAWIHPDAGLHYSPLDCYKTPGAGNVEGGVGECAFDTINLWRRDGGFFDSATFGAGGANRGKLLIVWMA